MSATSAWRPAGSVPRDRLLARVPGVVVTAAVLLLLPTAGSSGLLNLVTGALVLMSAAMALNLMFGFAGQLSLGHSAFFGVGAYTTGVLVSLYGWSPWWTFPVAFAVAFVVGLLVALPALRIRGIYLGLVTLAFALLFPNVLRWRKLAWLTGGSSGLDGTGFDFDDFRTVELAGWDVFGDLRSLENRTAFYYWLAAAVAVVVHLVCRGVVRSRVGRSLVAIRDDELAASTMGIDVALTKATVIGLSAGLCALPGCVSAVLTGNVTPDSTYLTLTGATIFLVAVIVGGAGTLWGPVVGALAYVYILDKTGEWADDDAIPRVLEPVFGWSQISPGNGIFAVLLILLMFVAPTGLVGVAKRLARGATRARSGPDTSPTTSPARGGALSYAKET